MKMFMVIVVIRQLQGICSVNFTCFELFISVLYRYDVKIIPSQLCRSLTM